MNDHASKPSGDATPQESTSAKRGHATVPPPPSDRRTFVKKVLAGTIGAVVALVPVVAGAVMFLDPLRSKKRRGDGGSSADGTNSTALVPDGEKGGSPGEGAAKDAAFIKVTTLDAIPVGGPPQFFKVVSDRTDAWTYFPDEPVGSVYLRQPSEGKVIAFNATCPHAGCAVGFRPGKDAFLCPCHDSLFSIDGERSEESPSPRGLDRLEVQVQNGGVWVKYQDFRTGTAERVPVA